MAATAGRARAARLALVAVVAGGLVFVALHRGSYSAADRQLPGALLWLALGIAALAGLLPAVRPSRRITWPLAMMVGLGLWVLLELEWTESAGRTYLEFARLVALAAVPVAIWLVIGRTTWRLAAAGLLAAGIAVCLLVVLSRLWPAPFPPDLVAARFKTTRVNYPFGYWNAVGCWGAMTLTLCLAWAAHARAAITRALALAAVPVAALAIYLTLSRAGIGGAILGSTLVVVLARFRWLTFALGVLAGAASLAVVLVVREQPAIVHATGTQGAWTVAASLALAALICGIAAGLSGPGFGEYLRLPRRIGRPAAIAGVAVVLLAAIAVSVIYGGRAVDEFRSDNVHTSAAMTDVRLTGLSGNRHNLWASALDAFESQPLIGRGPGTFEFWWSRNGVNGEFVRDAHNIYLEALAETGIVGLVLLLGLFVSLVAVALSSRGVLGESPNVGVHGGLIAAFCVFVAQAGLDWMWESTAVAVFALSVVACAGTVTSEPWRGRHPARDRVAIPLTALGAILVLMSGVIGEHQLERSQSALHEGDRVAALAAASDAIKTEPWLADAYAQRALTYENAGDLDAAWRDIAVAEAKEPTNWRWPLIGLRIQAARGEKAAAVEQLAAAKRLRRYQPLFGNTGPSIP
ncbi:MAG: O-antigen ligase family protein [Solirubrobacterales bacterium]